LSFGLQYFHAETQAIAKMQLREDAEAVGRFLRSIEANRNYPLAHFWLANALALLGSLDQARAAANAGLALDPSFTIRRFRDGGPSDNPTFLAKRERLRACGWPGCQRGEGFGTPVAYRPDDHKVITPLLQPNVADAFLSNLGVKGQAALTRTLR
jgi:hypothetical protein